MIRRIRFFITRSIRDLEPGDFVRRVGYRGAGLVESVSGDHAVVAWNRDIREILPIICLRRVQSVGHEFDAK